MAFEIGVRIEIFKIETTLYFKPQDFTVKIHSQPHNQYSQLPSIELEKVFV